MSKCDDLFQERQRLINEKAGTQADLSRIRSIQASSNMPSEEEFARQAGKMADDIEEIQASGEVQRAIANPKSKEAETNIPKEQPTNIAQALRSNPEEWVENWAVLSKALQRTGQRLSPDQWEFIKTKGSLNTAARTISESMGGDWNLLDVIGLIEKDADVFNGAIERTFRLRYFYEQSKLAYINVLEEIGDFMDKSELPTSIPPDVLNRSLSNFKLAVMSERQYDYVRNTWSNMGKAMQGQGFDFDSSFAVREFEGINRKVGDSAEIPTVQEIREMQPSDFTEESTIGRVLQAADLFKTNRKEAMKQLEMEIKIAKIEGVDPFKKLNPKEYEDRMFRALVTLAKDSQLFNLRTQALNIGSNINMALYGPIRKTLEDIQYGTGFMKTDIDGFIANYKGYGAALKATRDAGKEVFLDALSNKSMLYTGQVDTYGRFFKANEERIAELERMIEYKPISKRDQVLERFNPIRWARNMHAGSRLWMYYKTGNSYFLRPGLNTLAAGDNLAGFFFHHYHLRSDLELKARRNGVQLNLMDADGNLDMRKANDWIEKEYKESFYSEEVGERQIKQFRKQRGLTSDMIGDTEVQNIIREELVAKKYGAPVLDTDEAMSAARFSDEMRFQKAPDEHNLGKGLYEGVKTLRREQAGSEVLFPYLQAPMMGTSLDLSAIGLGPAWDTFWLLTKKRNFSPKEMRRLKANWAMTGFVWTTYLGLSSQDLIVGNGPLDPKANAQWRAELAAQGKIPNSIAGVPFVGGLPVISAVFLIHDVIENQKYGMSQRMPGFGNTLSALPGAIFGTIAGHLTRNTALGNLKQLTDLAYGDEYGRRNFWKTSSYIAGGFFNPLTGPMRQTERGFNSQAGDLFRERPWSEDENDLFDRDILNDMESKLRGFAYNTTGLSGVLGGKYKDKDWLGTTIRLPWGMDYGRYLKHRFFPHDHPQDKVYAELNRVGLLNPPGPLMKKTLQNVPMSDDLQQQYNEIYGSITGDVNPTALLSLAGGSKTINLKRNIPIDIKTGSLKGLRINKTVSGDGIDLSIFLAKHVRGKTALQAFRSLINSELYKYLNEHPATTTDLSQKSGKQIKDEIPYKMLQVVKQYYAQLTENALAASETEAVENWKKLRDVYNDAITQKSFEDFKAFAGAPKKTNILEGVPSE